MAKAAEAALIDAATARALADGAHGDPFSVLGLHQRGKRWVLTAFVPGAKRLEVLAATAIAASPVEAVPGLFTAILPNRQPYRLRAANAGTTWEFDDPFRFGPVLGELDEYLLGEGTHRRLWQVLGAHQIIHEGVAGTHFAVWAPNAQRVSVVGDFNIWDGRRHPMRRRGATGVWETFIPGLGEGAAYKYELRGPDGGVLPLKADPVGFGSEHPPANASVVRSLGDAPWLDSDWMSGRAARQSIDAAISVYEVHLGSWRRAPGNRMLSYLELAEQLVGYVADMGFTHIELMPVSEFPFDGSWGYQPVGLYAPTIRHGTPPEFRTFIEAAHRKGLGVLLDWVPGHFPTDPHGLGRFDGTPLYEHQDPREGFHQDWNTLIYNYGRVEVSNFLVSNALYWLEEYHLDGLRVDAVASMLYRDYSRNDGQWLPNRDGGRENYEAIALLQRMNVTAYGEMPGIVTVAEESTAFPGVSRPVNHGGLGFGFKWNMGWMHDTLNYMSNDPVHRRWNHENMTFGLLYAFTENFVLPLSHDEVVHGKRSILGRMPGDHWQRFANLRAYYSFMFASPGKKLLFMGCEFGQEQEWNHDQSLDWHLLDEHMHRGVANLVRDLNRLYATTPALHAEDCEGIGFEWIDCQDRDHSIFAFLRKGDKSGEMALIVCNFTPVPRHAYQVGVPKGGNWREVLNSDAAIYGGSDLGNDGNVQAKDTPWHGRPFSLSLVLPPLGAVILLPD